MQYFTPFPKVFYDQSGRVPGNPIIATNIMVRAKLRDSIKKNALVYYTYDVKDTDTPEIVAEKYYGDANRHWIVMFANNIIDPFYDWVLPNPEFIKYIIAKYGSVAVAQSTIDHYTKTIQKYDSSYRTTTSNVFTIDKTTYDALPDTEVDTINLKNGTTVIQTITRQAVKAYDYEFDLNEAKRKIILLDKKYAGILENELKALMAL